MCVCVCVCVCVCCVSLYTTYVLYRLPNEMLEKENRMFEKFLKRLDPKDFQLRGTYEWHTSLYSVSCTHIFTYV